LETKGERGREGDIKWEREGERVEKVGDRERERERERERRRCKCNEIVIQILGVSYLIMNTMKFNYKYYRGERERERGRESWGEGKSVRGGPIYPWAPTFSRSPSPYMSRNFPPLGP
jgi:hypothetical protein